MDNLDKVNKTSKHSGNLGMFRNIMNHHGSLITHYLKFKKLDAVTMQPSLLIHLEKFILVVKDQLVIVIRKYLAISK